MEYTTVTGLFYADKGNKIINCIVDFKDVGKVPFTATASDIEAHCKDIFTRAKRGDFGAIEAFSPPTTAELAVTARINFVKERTKDVEKLTITTTSGKVFNGDEVSQSRMVRAIVAAGIVSQASTKWTLANNVSTTVTLAELQEALAKSMQAMAAIWVQS